MMIEIPMNSYGVEAAICVPPAVSHKIEHAYSILISKPEESFSRFFAWRLLVAVMFRWVLSAAGLLLILKDMASFHLIEIESHQHLID